MFRLPNIACLFVLVTAVFVSCAKRESPGQDALFTFQWNAPIRFAVEETAIKKDLNAKIHHTFELTKQGSEFFLKWVDVKFVSINGESVSFPEMQKELSPALAMWIAWPPMKISGEGEFLETVRSKEAIEEINRRLDEMFPDRPEEVRQFYSKMADSSEGRALADAAMAERYWNTWVGAWIGFAVEFGKVETNDALASWGNREFVCKQIISNLGLASNDTNLMHLRLEQVADGPDVGQAIVSLVDGISKAVSMETSSPFPEITNANYRIVWEVETNPHTLKPQLARKSVELIASNPEIGEVAVREFYEFKFHWDISPVKGRK